MNAVGDRVGTEEWMSGEVEFLNSAAESIVFLRSQVREPLKWSAEHPNLYTLLLTLRDSAGEVLEVMPSKIGFREVEMMIHAMPDDLIDQAVALLADRDEVLEVSAGTPVVT